MALGGGAALGLAHIGVLRALEEYEVKVSFLSGTSVGGLIAAFYAFGKTPDEMQEVARTLGWLDLTDFTLSKLGLFSNRKIEFLLKKHLKGARFSDANIPFAVVTTDITNGEKVVLKDGLVSEAIMATTCVPGVFVPVEVGGRLLIDGAISENIPVSPLVDLGADYYIAVDLRAEKKPKRPSNVLEVLLHTFHYAIVKNKVVGSVFPDITVAPDLKKFGLTSLNKCDDLVEAGYKETVAQLKGF